MDRSLRGRRFSLPGDLGFSLPWGSFPSTNLFVCSCCVFPWGLYVTFSLPAQLSPFSCGPVPSLSLVALFLLRKLHLLQKGPCLLTHIIVNKNPQIVFISWAQSPRSQSHLSSLSVQNPRYCCSHLLKPSTRASSFRLFFALFFFAIFTLAHHRCLRSSPVWIILLGENEYDRRKEACAANLCRVPNHTLFSSARMKVTLTHCKVKAFVLLLVPKLVPFCTWL